MAKNVDIAQKNTGDVRTALEDNQITDFMVAPLQDLSTFDGSLIQIDGTGNYSDFTMSANLEITFAESGHEKGNWHVVEITADGTDTLTFTNPVAYQIVNYTGLTNGATLASGVYSFGFFFDGVKINIYKKTGVLITNSAPLLSNIAVDADNGGVTLTFNKGCYANNDGTGDLQAADFTPSLASGTATNPVLSVPTHSAGDSTAGFTLAYTGTADGNEVLTITPADGSSVYEISGVAMDSGQTANDGLNDQTLPTITSLTMAADNTYCDLLLSKGIYGANDGSTPAALTDLSVVFAANGGTATDWVESSAKQNDSVTEGSASALAGGETTIRIFGAISGTADGNETVTVTPADGSSLYDVSGNAMNSGESAVDNLNTISLILFLDAADDSKITIANGEVSLFNDSSTQGNNFSQDEVGKRPNHISASDYVQYQRTNTEFLEIAGATDLEFQVDESFSILTNFQIPSGGPAGDTHGLLVRRTATGGSNVGWYVTIIDGIMYFGLHDGTTNKSITDNNGGAGYNNNVRISMIFTHAANGDWNMYDETNTLVATASHTALNTVDYTGLNVCVGVRNQSESLSVQYTDGFIGDVKAWNKVLSAAERNTELGL